MPTFTARLRLLPLLAAPAISTAADTPAVPPNGVQEAMYFRSAPQDAPECKPSFANGRVDWGSVANPAATCPDAFGWVSFLQAIDQGFWTWATDQTLWPSKPKPICAEGSSGPDCCDPQAMAQTPPYQGKPDPACPYFPPDWTDAPELSSTTARLTRSHQFGFLRSIDPARILRQEEAEIVFRNRSFVRYTFEQNLYTKEGLGARFTAASNWTAANAPYRNRALQVSYPSDAVMFKADFISEKLMRENGLIRDIPGNPVPNNPEAPYISLMVDAQVGGNSDFKPGRYYLLAITAASKALPGWHWYAIEHVANPGRCDYNGCNDSFGFTALARSPSGAEIRQNFIAPHTAAAFDSTTPGGTSAEVIFDLGKPYSAAETGEEPTALLAALMKSMGIGQGRQLGTGNDPTEEDPAWNSYRLKGTQIDFVTAEGMEINLGASITEGGFVSSASCMTCHSQAGPNATGNPGLPGVGAQPRLSDIGYGQTVFGPPDLGWFYSYGTPQLISLQTDFVWGMLNASCAKPDGSTGNCAIYEVAAPKAVAENFK